MKTGRYIFIGDSITVGTYTKNGDASPNEIAKPNYATIVSDFFNAKCVNYAMNGISYSSTSPVNSENCICRRIDVVPKGDLLFVAGGTNDFGTNVMIGSESDLTDISFCGAVDITFRKILKNYNEKDVFIILPIIRFDQDTNGIKKSLNDYRNVLISESKKYGFNVIDTSGLMINPSLKNDRERIMYDGVHINEEGHKLYAQLIIDYLERRNEDK